MNDDPHAEVFAAVAHPFRRRILAVLAEDVRASQRPHLPRRRGRPALSPYLRREASYRGLQGWKEVLDVPVWREVGALATRL
jgi:hypothetical protein